MKNTIAKLLIGSGNGMIDRREILQALGLTATAAFAASAMPNVAASGKGYKAVAVNHISYNVADVAKTCAFYVDLLGMKVVWKEDKAPGVPLRCSIQFGDPPNILYIKSITHGEKANVDHFAFSIEDFDAAPVKEELTRRGLDPKYDGPYAWNILDPDGHRFQISAIKGLVPGAVGNKPADLGKKDLSGVPQPTSKSFKAIAVNHISYEVADYARSRDFYVDLLGMKTVFDDGNQCALEFGDPAAPNGLYISNVKQAGDKATIDSMAYSIANWNRDRVEAELKRRDLDPKSGGKYAWIIKDPDGYTVQICATKGVYPGAEAPGAPPEAPPYKGKPS